MPPLPLTSTDTSKYPAPDFPALHPLLWTLYPALYTDGACEPQGGGPNLLGAAFYDTKNTTAYTVQPNGKNETNTITRAELAGIYAALQYLVQHPTEPTHMIIFTDSLASLYLIQKMLRLPDSLYECKHALLLHLIIALLLNRAKANLTTHIMKVKSHIGIQGNELADKAAADAIENPNSCHFSLSGNNNLYFSTLPAWPCLTNDADTQRDTDPLMPELISLSG